MCMTGFGFTTVGCKALDVRLRFMPSVEELTDVYLSVPNGFGWLTPWL